LKIEVFFIAILDFDGMSFHNPTNNLPGLCISFHPEKNQNAEYISAKGDKTIQLLMQNIQLS